MSLYEDIIIARETAAREVINNYIKRTVNHYETKIAAYERLRPEWAKGYTSDSIAAQAALTALHGLWTLLGVDNQTQAVEKIKTLLNGQ